MKICTLLLLLCLSGSLQAQQVLAGQVIDAETGDPVGYVNIGFVNKVCGTVSDEKGFFRLKLISGIRDEDSLVFSCLGYQRQAYPFAGYKKIPQADLRIRVRKSSIVLQEQVVHAGAQSRKLDFGYFSGSKRNKLSLSSSVPGAEMATVIDFGERFSVLQHLRFHIISSSTDTLLFRLNIYPLVDNKPQQNICTEQIFIHTRAAAHLCETNLAAYHLRVKGKCLVSLEWIRNTADAGTIDLTATQKTMMYYRAASQADWVLFRKASPAIQISALQYQ